MCGKSGKVIEYKVPNSRNEIEKIKINDNFTNDYSMEVDDFCVDVGKHINNQWTCNVNDCLRKCSVCKNNSSNLRCSCGQRECSCVEVRNCPNKEKSCFEYLHFLISIIKTSDGSEIKILFLGFEYNIPIKRECSANNTECLELSLSLNFNKIDHILCFTYSKIQSVSSVSKLDYQFEHIDKILKKINSCDKSYFSGVARICRNSWLINASGAELELIKI